MARAVKKRTGELLEDSDIKNVISLLNAEKPITKTAACKLLNITYNVKRLANVIAKYEADVAFCKQRRAAMRGKPISDADAGYIIEAYLNGVSIQDISDKMFRSVAVLKAVLETWGVPLRNAKADFQHPVFLPDCSLSEEYKKGDLVYSAGHVQHAIIERLVQDREPHGKCYLLWLLKDCTFATRPYYELGDLTKPQKQLGLDFK